MTHDLDGYCDVSVLQHEDERLLAAFGVQLNVHIQAARSTNLLIDHETAWHLRFAKIQCIGRRIEAP